MCFKIGHHCVEASLAISKRYAGSRTEDASAKQSVLNSEIDPTHKSVSPWAIMLDGFLISACARTQSVIAQSSCEAEYIAATAATSEAKYMQYWFVDNT